MSFILLVVLPLLTLLFAWIIDNTYPGKLKRDVHLWLTSDPTRVFTIEELSYYSGKNESTDLLNYVAINGRVWDVTSSKMLRVGGHYYMGGSDATLAVARQRSIALDKHLLSKYWRLPTDAPAPSKEHE